MPKDYKEMYLKEKMKRLSVEGELMVLKHERFMLSHEATKAELAEHQLKKVMKESEKIPTKKTTKRKKKNQ